jgi:hypothetical protein
MHNLFLVYFFNFYMFRAYLGPSAGGTISLLSWFVKPGQQSSKNNNKYQLLYTYGCTSWGWIYIRPKHVEVDEIY